MSNRWKLENEEKFIYTKESLLELFVNNDDVIPENYTAFEGITIPKGVEPVNKSNTHKITTTTKINPISFGFGRGGARGGKTTSGTGRGSGPQGLTSSSKRGGRSGKSENPRSSVERKTQKEKVLSSIEIDSLWQYKDKTGEIHVGPFILSKLIEWVESGFHDEEMEIKQEGDNSYIKLKDVIQELEKNGKLKKGMVDSSDEEEEEEQQKQVKQEVVNEKESNIQIGTQHLQHQMDDSSNFFSDIPLQFGSNDPWNSSGGVSGIENAPNMISASDIEKNLKLALNISQQQQQQPKQKNEKHTLSESEKRKKQFDDERKIHLEEHRKNLQKKTVSNETNLNSFGSMMTPSQTNVGFDLGLVGSGWNENPTTTKPKTLNEIQKEQRKEQKKEKKMLDEKRKEEQLSASWSTNPIQVKSLSEIQKEQKKEKKKELMMTSKKPKVQNSNQTNAWSSNILSSNVVPFQELQKKDSKKLKETSSLISQPKVQPIPSGAWSSGALIQDKPSSFSKIQAEEKKKKVSTTNTNSNLKKNVNATNAWNTNTKLTQQPTQQKKKNSNQQQQQQQQQSSSNSFWDDDEDEEEEEEKKEETNAFTSQKTNNAFGGLEPSNSFKEWYKKQMTILGKKSDLTLIH
eukprot:gene10504-3026_t